MTRTAPHGNAKGAAVCFAEARIAAEAAEAVQQRQAARRVAEHSRDVDDCRDLLLMLGLSGITSSAEPHSAHPVRDDQTVASTFPEALGVLRSTEGARR